MLTLRLMREKAFRWWLSILFVTGSLAAYPQNSFPENLQHSSTYWGKLTIEGNNSRHELRENWERYSKSKLMNEQLEGLEKAAGIATAHAESLSKADREFLLKYRHLAIYLSGYNPEGKGNHDRVGTWLLTFPDARRYGLVVNDWVDERKDVLKSTSAARRLFEDLKKQHGENTELAFVLGSAGLARTTREQQLAIEEALTAIRLSTKSESGKAVLLADKSVRQKFNESISVAVLLTESGWKGEAFRKANPTLIGQHVPAGYEVVLPAMLDGDQMAEQTRFQMLARQKSVDSVMHRIKNDIPSPETHEVITYRVKSGDVLSKIAHRYGVPVAKIKKWNNLRSDRIDINQRLTIYYPKGKNPPKPQVAEAKPKQEETKPVEEIGSFTIYVVQPGDTLWAISKRFEGVKPEQIMAWNGIGEDLSIGQKLKIKVVQ